MSDGPAGARPHAADRVGRALEGASGGLAAAGGVLLVAIALIAAGSIAGRVLFSAPLAGDFELVQMASAVCIACFMPWCQIQRGNIIVDFFTSRAAPRVRGRLDAAGALLVAVTMALLAWRTGAGAGAIEAAGETSMIMGLPLWLAYAGMVPGLALTALAGFYMAVRDWIGPRP